MLIAVGLLCESFIASIAGIGFFTGVGAQVVNEGFFLYERFSTVFAGMWSIPSVGAQVYLETAFRCVFFATDLMRDGIYYKFANIRIRRISLLRRIRLLIRISLLSLFIRIIYWAIGL